MLKIRMAKIAGLAVGASVAFGAFVPMAGAVTIAELQAQINALMAQLAALQGTTVTTSAAIASDLTVGSTGAEVVTLQSALVAQGHLVMPAGVAMGYFGSLTKAAVMKWQAANGVPATGYFGPLSRAKFNGSAGATGTVPGATVTTSTTVSGVITTPGVEGTITVSLNPSPAGVKMYEGDVNKDVLGIKLEAKTSDIKVERVKLKLDENDTTSTSDTDFYRKIATKVYVKDGSTVLGSMDLDINTVVKDGTSYYITVAGLSFVVPKGTTKVLTVALDAMGAWDDTFNGDSWKITVPIDGVRGVDGAAVNQYGPATAFERTFTSESELSESATLSLSTNSGTPLATQVICTSSSTEDECDELELLRFDLKAEKDNVTLTDLIVDINMTGGDSATATTAWLYDGATQIGSATLVELTGEDSATFTDIDYVIPVNTTKTLSVKVDIRGVDAASNSFAANIDVADVTAENAAGTGITESGTAVGKTIEVRKVGPQLTLVSKSITTDGVPQGQPAANLTSTSTLTATFNLKVKAVGGDIVLGTVASGTPVFASSTGSFALYRNGSYDGSIGSAATSTSYSIPSTCVSTGTNSCVLSEGAEVTIPVTWKILGRIKDTGGTLPVGSLYSVGFEGFEWVAKDLSTVVQRTTFMATSTDWRTADVSFP